MTYVAMLGQHQHNIIVVHEHLRKKIKIPFLRTNLTVITSYPVTCYTVKEHLLNRKKDKVNDKRENSYET